MRERQGHGSVRRVASAIVLVAVLGAATSGGAGAQVKPSPDGSKVVSRHMRAKRYCEVLLVTPTDSGIVADVYNSYPLNDCPGDRWNTLDATVIAAEQGAPLAILNGPRYWLMDRVAKFDAGERVTANFGGIEMTKAATVEVGSLADAATKYVPHFVDRSTIFTFNRGVTIYELLTTDGERYVMQTWSQQVDPSLGEADLAGLGDRLQLPEGWTFRARTLRAPLRVVTTNTKAAVLQDDLNNSYSRQTER